MMQAREIGLVSEVLPPERLLQRAQVRRTLLPVCTNRTELPTKINMCSNNFCKEYKTGTWGAVDSRGSAKNPTWRIHSGSKLLFEITNVKKDELYVYEVQLVIFHCALDR